MLADAARFAKHRQAQFERDMAAAPTPTDKALTEARYAEYLLTEKQAIFANAAAAERWMGFAENADLYPNLEYRTVGDSDVRSSHAKLDGIVLPYDDPFWKGHTPPLDWGCRCELIQTDIPVRKPEGYADVLPGRGFDFNPGTDQKIFDDKAGYYSSVSKAESEELTREATHFIVKNARNYGVDAVGTSVINKIGEINITSKSRKEWLNQPHADYAAKNMMLENSGFLKGLKFAPGPNVKDNPMVARYWLAKIELMEKTSVVIVREMVDGTKLLYSISDNVDKYKDFLK